MHYLYEILKDNQYYVKRHLYILNVYLYYN